MSIYPDVSDRIERFQSDLLVSSDSIMVMYLITGGKECSGVESKNLRITCLGGGLGQISYHLQTGSGCVGIGGTSSEDWKDKGNTDSTTFEPVSISLGTF